ncbi:hypothetical protein IW262DRAFT_1262373 [Armillaria fumosa]|nr:hypothetical protein IW262DRAFT_1262373 [Armillaria fumosa]
MAINQETTQVNALYPLTPFDDGYSTSIFITGWLVEGVVDVDVLAGALDRLTAKWRSLAGRLEGYNQSSKKSWRIVVPLGDLPPNYQTYSLTTCPTIKPIAFPTILPSTIHSLPSSLFLHPDTPHSSNDWGNRPLTCWHITRLCREGDAEPLTAIGFARPHGVFDGTGAKLIVNALISEIKGLSWAVPPVPKPGANTNVVLKVLDNHMRSGAVQPAEFAGYTDLKTLGTMKLVFNQLRKRVFQDVQNHLVILKKDIVDFLVADVRQALHRQGKISPRVSTGDILVAWLWKAVYAHSADADLRVHCTNLASFRGLLAQYDPEIQNYPHNAFVPLPYPRFTVADLKSLPLHDLSYQLASGRTSLSLAHVHSAEKTFKTATFAAPLHPQADETFFISNVSATRILEADWTSIGAKRTICGFRYALTVLGSPLTNAAYISGHLPDKSVLLDVILTRSRMQALTAEVDRLEALVAPKA